AHNTSGLGNAIGGVWSLQTSGTGIQSSIIAQNVGSGFGPNDVNGAFYSAGFNFIGDGTGGGGFGGAGSYDQVGSKANPFDPLLSTIGNYGGPTNTVYPQQVSPTIDQGYSGKRKTDQRGRKRPFEQPSLPRPASGDGSDIGAFEVSPVSR